MKRIASAWNNLSLILRIVIGLVVGVALGLIGPAIHYDFVIVPLLGTLFVSALKAAAPILVFFLVISALANAKTSGAMKSVVIMYIISTFVAAAVAVLFSVLFPTTLTLTGIEGAEASAPSGIGQVLLTLFTNAVSNPVGAIANANFIGILTWAVLLGIALRAASKNTKNVLSNIADALIKVVRWVIACAPFGIMGLAYSAIAENGLNIFVEYGHLILVLVACMLFIALVTNPIIAFVAFRKNPYPLILRCLKDSGITAFFTRSSAANIPVNMALCQKLGLDKNNYSVSIPLGATINMAGAAVTITVMAMAAAHTMGVSVDIPTAILLSAMSAVGACGASGVPGGSLLLIPLAYGLFGIDPAISFQCVAIGLIIGVIQDSCETALNSSSDVIFTASAEYRALMKAGKPFAPGKDNGTFAEPEAETEVAEAAEVAAE
ncbi:MAG: serine/threonine transporter SstT [Eggerthellaceae bacterium]|nr:serine/threonine transporter SstT [Eggerthellaceae bacterium]